MDKEGLRNIQKKLKLTNETTAATLGVELFTVQQWCSGVWEIPPIADKALHILQANDRAYAYGYDQGYTLGCEDGHVQGQKAVHRWLYSSQRNRNRGCAGHISARAL